MTRWIEIEREKNETKWNENEFEELKLEWEEWTYVNVWRCHQIIVVYVAHFFPLIDLKRIEESHFNIWYAFYCFARVHAHAARTRSDCRWWNKFMRSVASHAHHQKQTFQNFEFPFNIPTQCETTITITTKDNHQTPSVHTKYRIKSKYSRFWSSFVFMRSFIFASRVNWAEACDNNVNVFETGAREKRKTTNNEPNSSQEE